MSKEYHLYNVQRSGKQPEQAYVFGVERDMVNKTLELVEMFIFTLIDGVEVKHRIDINGVMHNMFPTIGGTVSHDIMNKVMDDIVNSVKVQEKVQEPETNHFTNGMLMATEHVNMNHKSLIDFNNVDEYLQYLARSKS